MLVNLVDKKQSGKFCKKFIFDIYKYTVNFHLDWTTQLVLSHCPLVTQNYPQASLYKLQKLFQGMRLLVVKSNLF